MSNLNTMIKLPTGNFRSPKGRMAYTNNVFRPAAQTGDDGAPQKDKSGREIKKYQLTLVFPKNTDMKPFLEAVEAAAIAKWGADYKKKLSVKKPFLKTEDYPKMGFDPEEFPFFIRMSSSEDRPPSVRRANTTTITAEQADEVYSGRWAVASFNLYCTEHPRGGNRVSCGLGNIQVLDHDEPVGGGVRANADDEFEAIGEEGAVASTDDLFA